jgi:hypothetical protein
MKRISAMNNRFYQRHNNSKTNDKIGFTERFGGGKGANPRDVLNGIPMRHKEIKVEK